MARNAASTRTTPTYPRMGMGEVYIPGAKSIEGATGDTARTTSGWIENEKFAWYAYQTSTAWSAEFDTAVTRTGAKTLKLSNTDTLGRVSAYNWDIAGLFSKYLAKIKPSTEYTLNCWVKTTNVASLSAHLDCYEYNAAGVQGASNLTNRLSGTNDWTLCTKTFTTAATAAFLLIGLNITVAGNVSDAWFDVNSMTLIETGVSRSAAVARNPVV